jgi:prepilin-type N-terminal cleavage/methylation domain-containing protein
VRIIDDSDAAMGAGRTERQRRTKVVRLAREVGRRRGFTLVELLVVLAILVLLFGLLFAPMMTGLDMARAGQSRARMQDTARYAMEEIRRTVGNAVYVVPLDIVQPASAAPGLGYANLSTVTVVSPRRSVTGVLASPLQPATRPNASTGVSWLEAVRFTVHPQSGRIVRFDDDAATRSVYPPGTTKPLAQPSSGMMYEPMLEDPFVLHRQVGVWYLDPSVGEHRFGRFDGAGNFVSNEPFSENALTQGYDIQCSGSVCDNCGARAAGFRRYDLGCTACGAPSPGYTYLFDGAQFRPQRAAGEQLTSRPDGTLYSARQGGWTGDSYYDVNNASPQLFQRQLEPRVRFLRYDVNTGGHTDLQYDTYSVPPTDRGNPQLAVTWDRDAGAVKCGRFYLQRITLDGVDPNVNVSWVDDQATVQPIRPPSPPSVVPTGYRIDPNPAAIILPHTVKVRVVANLSGGETRWFDLVQSDQYEQDEIGAWQFAIRRELPPQNWEPWIPEDWATSIDVLFNNRPAIGPPGVAKFAAMGMNNVTSIDIYIQYWARRNADIYRGPGSTGRDDIVCVDYHTRNVLDVSLTVADFVDYMEDAQGNRAIPAPPPMTQQAALHDTVAVRNAGR